MTEDEIHGGVKVLKGDSVPTVLPAKGVGVFKDADGFKFFTLAQYNASDTIIRTPVTFKNAVKLFFNLFRNRD